MCYRSLRFLPLVSRPAGRGLVEHIGRPPRTGPPRLTQPQSAGAGTPVPAIFQGGFPAQRSQERILQVGLPMPEPVELTSASGSTLPGSPFLAGFAARSRLRRAPTCRRGRAPGKKYTVLYSQKIGVTFAAPIPAAHVAPPRPGQERPCPRNEAQARSAPDGEADRT